MDVRPRGIDLHIEELVLEGFPAGDRVRIGEAVGAELARLLSAPDATGVLTALDGGARLSGGSFEVVPGAGPEWIGAQVARSAYRGLHP